MSNLQHRQSIIQEKRKKTPWRDFVMEIASWYPLTLNKIGGIISLYPETNRSPSLVSHKKFTETIDSLNEYGIDFDPHSSFFENYQKLFLTVPFSCLYNYSGSENSDFAFSVYNSKNCYLSFTVITDCENIIYSFAVKEGCKNILNSSQISNFSENVYQSHCVLKSYNIFYSKFVENCTNIWFSSNLIGCQECILCNNLNNKSYCIENKQYEKVEYERLKTLFLNNEKINFEDNFKRISNTGVNNGSEDIQDCNYVTSSYNVQKGRYSFNLNSARNTLIVGSPYQNTHIYDSFEAGSLGNSHFYGVLNTGVKSEYIYNCEGVVGSYMIFYSRFLENCSFCLGCIGLKNKSYCILNKQYTKEERYEKVDEIFGQMHGDGVLGDFFPASMNPFYFNDTIGYLVELFTKEEVITKGYLRRDEPIKVDIPAGVQTVSVKDLDKYEGRRSSKTPHPDPLPTASLGEGDGLTQQRWIDDEILKKVIIDEQGNAYRIIPMELEFLRKYELPLPRKHWLDRMKENFRIN